MLLSLIHIYIWNPVSATVLYDGGQEEVALNEGKGSFTYTGNAYRVSVSYALYILSLIHI